MKININRGFDSVNHTDQIIAVLKKYYGQHENISQNAFDVEKIRRGFSVIIKKKKKKYVLKKKKIGIFFQKKIKPFFFLKKKTTKKSCFFLGWKKKNPTPY